MANAYGISFIDLQKEGYWAPVGSDVVIEDNSTYTSYWDGKYPNGTLLESFNKKLEFTAPEVVDETQMELNLIVKSPSGCTLMYPANITLVPLDPVTGKITAVENITRLVCGMIGAEVVGPQNTAETYKYAPDVSGDISYEWIVDGVTEASEINVSSVSDMSYDWSTIAANAPDAGENKEIVLHLTKKINGPFPAGFVPDRLDQSINCTKTVKVYPPLNVGISGDDLVCSDDAVKTFSLISVNRNAINITKFNWSINGNVVGGNEDKVDIDFNDRTLVSDYGDCEIELKATRTTPEGIEIFGVGKKTVKYEEIPILVGLKGYTAPISSPASGNNNTMLGNSAITLEPPAGNDSITSVEGVENNTDMPPAENEAIISVEGAENNTDMPPTENDTIGAAPLSEDTYSISGFVVDKDSNVLVGWQFNLSENGENIDNATSGDDGSFSFENVAAGNYTVNEIPKEGWSIIFPENGTLEVTISDSSNSSLNFVNQMIL
jgi:hypothetical protein